MKPRMNVRDRGQRYEVRMTGYGPNAPGQSVLGWSNTLNGAHEMMKAILTSPGCTSATIFDRKEKTKVITQFSERLWKNITREEKGA